MQKPDHISYSQIQTGRCLFRYKKLVLEKAIKRDSISMRLGKLVHKIIYLYSKQCIESRLEADYELMSGVIEAEFNDSKLPEEYYMQVRASCLRFGEHGFNYNTLLDYEKEFNIEIDKDINGTPIMIKGIIDRVNCFDTPDGACLSIIDYKNQMNINTEQEVREHMQLNLYRYIVLYHLYKNEGFYLSRTGIYYIKWDFIRWAGNMIHVNELADETEGIEKWLVRQWNRLILSEEYLPERGPHCFEYSGCPVLLEGQCPLWSDEECERMRSGRIVSDKIRILRIQDFDRKTSLHEVKQLVELGESFEVDNVAVGFSAKKSCKYKLMDFIDFAKVKEIDLSGLTITKSDAEKIIKQLNRDKQITDEENLLVEDMKIETATNKFVY